MEFSLSSVNILAVIVSAIVGVFGLGGIWYNVFGELWNKEANITKDMKRGHPAVVYLTSLLMGIIGALAFAILLGIVATLGDSIRLSLVIGAGFVATSFAINYSFGGRSIKLFAIDATYHILQFLIYGVIIGLWR